MLRRFGRQAFRSLPPPSFWGPAAVSLGLFWAAVPAVASAAATTPGVPAPTVSATSAVLMDANTGQILYEKRPMMRVAPGGLAAIMTFALALRAIRQGQLTPQTRITISAKVWHIALNPNDSRMFLEVGQRVPIKDLLLGLMVDGGDDAALALAEAVSGTEGAFVTAMNDEAKRLGLTGTHFMNPSGLANPAQYTDAMDLAKLAQTVVMRDPTYQTYTNVATFTWNGIKQTNFNPLIGTKHVTGLKAGHLSGPNWQLVTTATDQGTTFVTVVLGAPTELASATDTTNLLSWAEGQFAPVRIPAAHLARSVPVYEGSVGSVAVGPSRAVPSTLWIPRTASRHLKTRVTLPPHLVAPIPSGKTVGGWSLATTRGTVVYHVPLVTRVAVRRGNFLSVLIGKVRLFLDSLRL